MESILGTKASNILSSWLRGGLAATFEEGIWAVVAWALQQFREGILPIDHI